MDKISLKIIVTHGNKKFIYLIMAIIFSAFYGLSGAISYQSGVVLEMSSWEFNIPFLIWSIWIYIVLYPAYLIWALFSYKDIKYMNYTFYCFILLTVISCICFVLYPVIYPREFFPLSFSNDISTTIFRLMRKADKPSNCLPSLHVGICYLFSYGFKYESKSKYITSLFISTLIALSTLTTKQHYIYDIVLGFILATIIHCLFLRYTRINIE